MTATLTAWSIDHYGAPEVLNPVTRPMPTPGPTEILIRIRASAVTRADGMMRAGQPRFARLFLGLRRPRRNLSGTGLSGEVIAVGDKVSRFAVGDAVFGEAGLKFGANASHICLDESGVLMKKPDALSHEDAAVMCDGPLTSLSFPARGRAAAAGAACPDPWRVGQPRHGGGADRRGGRRPGHRHLQHPQRRHRGGTRGGPGHRLHPRGFHRTARALRCDLRHARRQFLSRGQGTADGYRALRLPRADAAASGRDAAKPPDPAVAAPCSPLPACSRRRSCAPTSHPSGYGRGRNACRPCSTGSIP